MIGGTERILLTLVAAVVILTADGQPADTLKADETTCQTLIEPVFIQPSHLPTTALASFQGSGNTWVRQILASSTGFKTGDIYSSYGNDIYPEFSSTHDDTVIAIKTHNFNNASNFWFKRAVVIVRHPLDALYSEFNRMYGGNKTGYAEKYNLINEDGSTTWKWDMWMTHISSWVDFYTYWIRDFKGPTHVLYYKNLKQNTVQELSAIIEFLGLKPDHYRMNCTIFHPKPSYFERSHTKAPVEKYDLFRLSMSKADRAIRDFTKVVEEKYGKESLFYKKLNLQISEPKLQ